MKSLQVRTAASVMMQRNADGIVFEAGKPYKYKGDCKKGQFYRGAANKALGSDLKGIVPLNFYTFDGALYKSKEKSTQWGELIFLDSNNVVGSILLKTASLDRFVALAQEVAIYENKSVFGNFKLDLTMEAKNSAEWGAYYNIEFSSGELDAEKQVEVQKFINGAGAFGLYNQFTCVEYAKQNLRLSVEDLKVEDNVLAVLSAMNIIEVETV